MQIAFNRKRIIIYLLLAMVFITSIYFIFKKYSVQKPIAAKLVFLDMEVLGE